MTVFFECDVDKTIWDVILITKDYLSMLSDKGITCEAFNKSYRTKHQNDAWCSVKE